MLGIAALDNCVIAFLSCRDMDVLKGVNQSCAKMVREDTNARRSPGITNMIAGYIPTCHVETNWRDFLQSNYQPDSYILCQPRETIIHRKHGIISSKYMCLLLQGLDTVDVCVYDIITTDMVFTTTLDLTVCDQSCLIHNFHTTIAALNQNELHLIQEHTLLTYNVTTGDLLRKVHLSELGPSLDVRVTHNTVIVSDDNNRVLKIDRAETTLYHLLHCDTHTGLTSDYHVIDFCGRDVDLNLIYFDPVLTTNYVPQAVESDLERMTLAELFKINLDTPKCKFVGPGLIIIDAMFTLCCDVTTKLVRWIRHILFHFHLSPDHPHLHGIECPGEDSLTYVIVDVITGQSLFTMPVDIEYSIVSVDRYGVVFETGFFTDLSVLRLDVRGLPMQPRVSPIRQGTRPLAYGYGYMVYLKTDMGSIYSVDDTNGMNQPHDTRTIGVLSFHQ